MNSYSTCPYCGRTSKLIPQRHAPATPGRAFEATAPAGPWASLLFFLRGNRHEPEPAPPHVTVKVEEWNYPAQTVKFRDMDQRVTWPVVCEIAEMVEAGWPWTRDNLIRHTSLTENRCRVYVREFKRLDYLHVTENNRSELTTPGRRFLRGCLAMKNGYRTQHTTTHNGH